LIGEFTFAGETVFVVGVHFNSKGGDDPLFGRRQPPRLGSEVQRINQARAVNTFVDEILACDPQANVVVLGDVNDFQFSPAVEALKGDALHNLMDLLPERERYSYVYQGNSQVLDQILVSAHVLGALSPEYDIVHVNAEFMHEEQVSDHDPSVVRLTLRN
jgi:predicted extracellular nuclease